MWRTRRGGTAPGAHALLPLPHLHHLLTPPSATPTHPHTHTHTHTVQKTACSSCFFSPHFLSSIFFFWWRRSAFLLSPPPPHLFTFLTATIFESPSGLLFSYLLHSSSSHFAVAVFPTDCVSQWDPANIHRCISFLSSKDPRQWIK